MIHLINYTKKNQERVRFSNELYCNNKFKCTSKYNIRTNEKISKQNAN